MYTLGSTFVPPGIHAGGLRYHGMAPLVSHVLDLRLIEASAVQQLDAFAAGIQFARAEGIIPAPEANHAVAGAICEALRAKEEGKQRTILFNLCGHGHFDMQSLWEPYTNREPRTCTSFTHSHASARSRLSLLTGRSFPLSSRQKGWTARFAYTGAAGLKLPIRFSGLS